MRRAPALLAALALTLAWAALFGLFALGFALYYVLMKPEVREPEG